jgi:hypothetical protein
MTDWQEFSDSQEFPWADRTYDIPLKKNYGLVYQDKIVDRFDFKEEAFAEGRQRYGDRLFEVVKFEEVVSEGVKTPNTGGGGPEEPARRPYLPVKLEHKPEHGQYQPPRWNYWRPGL